jgi:hypothetical protein
MPNDPGETARLRREFDALPKVHGHGEAMEERIAKLSHQPVILSEAKNPILAQRPFASLRVTRRVSRVQN